MIKLKLNIGGVVINDTVLEVQHEGFIYHYKVANNTQLTEAVNHLLQEITFGDLSFEITSFTRDGDIVIFDCAFHDSNNLSEIITVVAPFEQDVDSFYKSVFGAILSVLSTKLSLY